MQASKIKMRQHYAAKVNGREVEIRVVGLRTDKSESKTENYALAYIQNTDDTGQVAIPVEAVIGPLEEHLALKAEKAARQAKVKAEADALKARQVEVITVLAEAIGAQALTEGRWSGNNRYDENRAYVLADGTARIEINEHAWSAIVALIKRAEEGKVFRMRVGPSVPAFKAPEDAQ